MQITDKAAEAAKTNLACVAGLMVALNRSQLTIKRMLEAKHIILTTPAAVKAITTYTGLSENDVLEEISQLATAV